MAIRLDDGYQTLISMGGAIFGLSAFEKEVSPPGVDGNGMVDTTTMRNFVWRTRNAKHLKTLTDFTCTVAYSVDIYNDMVVNAQENQLITIFFPDLSQIDFYGFVDKFIPQASREGEQPTATITVVPTNQDLFGNEIAPVITLA